MLVLLLAVSRTEVAEDGVLNVLDRSPAATAAGCARCWHSRAQQKASAKSIALRQTSWKGSST